MTNRPLKLPGLESSAVDHLLPYGSIITGYVGSMAHNTYVPKHAENCIDDKDIMSIHIESMDTYLGTSKYGERDRGTINKGCTEDGKICKQGQGLWDSVSYELRKACHLMMKGNLNMLSLLWLNNNHYCTVDDFGQELLDNRELFSSKLAYRPIAGYADGQRKRMTTCSFEGYQGNKRREMFQKFGYDCKHAAHTIRILRMGIEFMNEGVLYVHRDTDAEMLRSIKRGEWPLGKIEDEASRLFQRLEEAYDRSSLPAKPDADAINRMVVDMILRYNQFYGALD